MTPPNLLLSSTQALSSVLRRVSYASIERGSIIVGFEAGTEVRPGIGGALGIEPVPCAEELPFAVEASRPTDDKAMSSRREVAASSLDIRVVSMESWNCTGPERRWVLASSMLTDEYW